MVEALVNFDEADLVLLIHVVDLQNDLINARLKKGNRSEEFLEVSSRYSSELLSLRSKLVFARESILNLHGKLDCGVDD